MTLSDDDLHNLEMLSLQEPGDARLAWDVIGYCIEKQIAFPPWVLDYLKETSARIEDHLVNRDEQHPHRLWEALGLDKLKRDPDAGYDLDRDPEEVFETITDWITRGECSSISAGAERYWKERLGGMGEPDTVRSMFYKGRKTWRPPEDVY